MTESEKSTQADWHDEDDAPDLSTPEWIEKFRSVPVRRGRPLIDTPKESTTIRLDADVLERFREGGPGWQTRINAALREWLDKQA
ncbi:MULTISPECIES: BrnA antitoxin family protein [unclassified Rhizobium]|uniref:BrnA antitoxin family protein n=1 Tax=unclassified Rhizobium TaxID=2613769 RepID=UPI001ADBEA16|nr:MULTISPECIES: BrnA antitoxin family protein [unclassified Rhizobium]MBO9097727.1 BrnA antitoxin family protein [Rhizobium sp. L58/93]MBO9133489.1 BrnA antitoxin family protein [Rhizobium sp. B209b/85]MBO9167877.1 BrnA antitoxin family protein [Rhizobium sp. L245/93]MBO9183922.1 BrnA antitoxin family protein [Rhizobium sp. E27B/91]QXZ84160.1 BrnA antitoxin family protein [Rhizobium sp. K1/93]